MKETDAVRRKLQLKNQALKLVRIEREALRHTLNLHELRDFLQKRTGEVFDPTLSGQLDAVQLLIESLSCGRPSALNDGFPDRPSARTSSGEDIQLEKSG